MDKHCRIRFSLLLCYQFDFNSSDFQNIEKILLSKFGISYFLGVDSLSLVFILLTSILFQFAYIIQSFLLSLDQEFMVCFLV